MDETYGAKELGDPATERHVIDWLSRFGAKTIEAVVRSIRQRRPIVVHYAYGAIGHGTSDMIYPVAIISGMPPSVIAWSAVTCDWQDIDVSRLGEVHVIDYQPADHGVNKDHGVLLRDYEKARAFATIAGEG